MNIKFKSRTDPFFSILVWFTPATMLIASFYFFASERAGAWAMLAVAVFTAVFIVILVYPCFYIIDGETLRIRAGIFRYTIPVYEIKEMKLEWSTLAAPALSFHRIRITLKSGEVKRISPKNRQMFVSTIEDLHIKAGEAIGTRRSAPHTDTSL